MKQTSSEADSPVRSGDRCTRLTQGARCTQVIESAIRLFAEKGFQGTKTKEIAEAAGINEALIFRDFQSKEKLYCAILEYASNRVNAQRWIEELTPVADRQDDQALFVGLAERLFQVYSHEPNLFRIMLYSALEQHGLVRKFRERQMEPIETFLTGYITQRQSKGAFGPGDPCILGRTFLNLCHHHVQRQILFGQGAEPEDAAAAAAMTQIFLNGVRSH